MVLASRSPSLRLVFDKCAWGGEVLAFIKFLFRLESTNVVVVEGLVVLEEDNLGDVVVQSRHEVELHPNGVVHTGSSQDCLHLEEVLIEGLGSLDGVLQLA